MRVPGNFRIATNYEVLTAAPFDARMVVELKSDLTDSTQWNPLAVYPGMIVAVSKDPVDENNGVYVLKKNTTTSLLWFTNEQNWHKLAGLDEFTSFQEQIETNLTNYVSKEEASEFVKMVIVEEGVDINTAVPAPEDKTLYFQKQSGNLYEYISYNGNLTIIGSTSGSTTPIDAYTKQEADERFALKTEIQGFITDTVDDLVNYYTKSETYTKTEVNDLISQISSISFEVVDSLPPTGEVNKIYLVPKTPGQSQDGYNEYIYVNSGWERIGSTDIDLSQYATIDYVTSSISTAVAELASEEYVTNAVSTATADMATNASVDSKLSNYVTNESLTSTLNNYALSSAIPTSLSQLTNDAGFTTISEVQSILENYVAENELETELAGKQDTLVSGTNIKTINGYSILGEGNIQIQGGSGGDISIATEDTVGGILATDNSSVEGVEAFVDVDDTGKASVKIPSVDETSTPDDVVNLLNTITLILNGNA